MTTPTLRRIAIVVLVFNLLLAGYGISRHRLARLKVTFLDVGQGDCAVIETPGGRVILVDTGGKGPFGDRDEGKKTVEPYLRHEGVSHIDAILLTHPHSDHIGGADTLLKDMPVDVLLDNGEPTQPALEQKLLGDAAQRNVPCLPVLRGEHIDLGDGVGIEILGPTADEVEDDRPNNCSIVVRLSYGRNVFLFTGDAEKREEQDLLDVRYRLKCDVLKVGHHGSDTSSTDEFIKACSPREAVVSVGAHNSYGHPSDDVIARLKRAGAHVDRTDKVGAVTCYSDGETVEVNTMR